MARRPRQKPDMIDSWAKNPRHARSTDYVCHASKVKVYFPVDVDTEPEAYEWFHYLRDIINQEFGGSTVYDGEGSWWDSGLQDTVIEPVKVIEVAHSCNSRASIEALAQAVVDAAQATHQQAISVDANEFHIIPTDVMYVPGSVIRPGDEW